MFARIIVIAICLVLVPSGAQANLPSPWTWPLDEHPVGKGFAPPEDDYGPGHRGIDIGGTPGDAVRAVAPGRVTFAGQVGGIAVVTIDHGQERSTYQPVRAHVEVGEAVERSQDIGTLLGSHSHCARACLHLGRLRGTDYLNPLDLLGGGRFRLIDPEGPPPAPPADPAGEFTRPVGGPVTSPFGMRVHPVTGVLKLHDGTDFGVPCGTDVHAAAAGTVVSREFNTAYGKRIIIRHRPGWETSYNHLSHQKSSVGDRVSAGEVIGQSGTTGMSTGCHLHFMTVKNGTPVNPQDYL